MKILVIDNYDSFTYNLVYLLKRENIAVDVFRNDQIEPTECLAYDGLILSPGPGLPIDAGNLLSIINECSSKIPILGVCLGHQAIAEHLGNSLAILPEVYHGVQSEVRKTDVQTALLDGVESTFLAARYHSWVISSTNLKNIEVTAVSEDNRIMAIQNIDRMLFGIQFHPESILTPQGRTIVTNFLSICNNRKQ